MNKRDYCRRMCRGGMNDDDRRRCRKTQACQHMRDLVAGKAEERRKRPTCRTCRWLRRASVSLFPAAMKQRYCGKTSKWVAKIFAHESEWNKFGCLHHELREGK